MESKEKAKKLMAERDKLDAEIEDNLAILAECTDVAVSAYENLSVSYEFQPTIVHRTSNKPFLKVSVVKLQFINDILILSSPNNLQVKVVETNSPAAKGGLKAGDLIIQYGDLHAANFKELEEVALTTNKYEGKKLCVTTLRKGRAVRLEIYPQSWSGSGMLGCGITAISRANST
uniref:26S proteasome non-ATPase regulatory subunit 9 n=1 Tax=Angiostrongylus cantonensis TaxID=6313 RepID=A0A0K0DBE4_ANGCA